MTQDEKPAGDAPGDDALTTDVELLPDAEEATGSAEATGEDHGSIEDALATLDDTPDRDGMGDLAVTPPPDADAPIWAGADGHGRGTGSPGARIEIHQGGSERIDAREVSVFQGGAGTIRADQVRVEQGGAFAIIGRRIDLRESGAVILLARRTTGDVRVLFDWRAIAALVIGLAVLLVVRGRR